MMEQALDDAIDKLDVLEQMCDGMTGNQNDGLGIAAHAQLSGLLSALQQVCVSARPGQEGGAKEAGVDEEQVPLELLRHLDAPLKSHEAMAQEAIQRELQNKRWKAVKNKKKKATGKRKRAGSERVRSEGSGEDEGEEEDAEVDGKDGGSKAAGAGGALQEVEARVLAVRKREALAKAPAPDRPRDQMDPTLFLRNVFSLCAAETEDLRYRVQSLDAVPANVTVRQAYATAAAEAEAGNGWALQGPLAR